MESARFWEIIESGGSEALDEPERQLDAIRARLASLSPQELEDFHQTFNRMMDDAYTWDLWGAAYLINGGCSDDGFAYFRSWLISRGRAVYEGAIAEPDRLAAVVDPGRDDYEFEDLWGIAQQVYEERTGGEMPRQPYRGPAEPRGRRWDFDDEEQVSRRLPKLADIYL